MMQYKKIKEKENIDSFLCIQDYTVVVSEHEHKIWLNDKVIFEGEGYLSAMIGDTDFLFFGNFERYSGGRIATNDFRILPQYMSPLTYSEKGAIIYENTGFNKDLGYRVEDAYYLDFKTGEKKLLYQQRGGGFRFSFDNGTKALYSDVGIIFECFSLDTCTYEWTVDLTHLGFMHPAGYYQNARVRSIWGITSDILVLSTYGDTLVGIDLKSGVIVWDLPFSKGLYPPDYQGNRWCWHLEDTYLYLLQHHYLLRFDTQTQRIETLWTGNPRYKIAHATYTPEYIYFTAIDDDLSLIIASIIGVFDRQKCEIIWQYDTRLPISRPLQTDGKHIYCHDDGNTLHIFEKIE